MHIQRFTASPHREKSRHYDIPLIGTSKRSRSPTKIALYSSARFRSAQLKRRPCRLNKASLRSTILGCDGSIFGGGVPRQLPIKPTAMPAAAQSLVNGADGVILRALDIADLSRATPNTSNEVKFGTIRLFPIRVSWVVLPGLLHFWRDPRPYGAAGVRQPRRGSRNNKSQRTRYRGNENPKVIDTARLWQLCENRATRALQGTA